MPTGNIWLFDNHAVPVREKPVTGSYSMFVGRQHKLAACECGNKHQQAGSRQMKIGEHGVGSREFETGADKEIGFAFFCKILY